MTVKIWLLMKQRRDWEEYPKDAPAIIRGYIVKSDAELEQAKLSSKRTKDELYDGRNPITYDLEEIELV